MTITQAIISGAIQGITEFFPVSSSGHLVILHTIFGIKEPMLAFDIFLHLGTVLSVLIFFHKDIIHILQRDRRLLKLLIIASIPTFLIGVLLKDKAETLFAMPIIVGYSLFATGIFLLLASLAAIYNKIARRSKPLGTIGSAIIGAAQGISVLPGISRSGATIGTALILGLNEAEALKFSFLLSIPAILGANMLKARQICGNLISVDTLVFMAGGVVAAATGIIAIKFMFGILRKNLFFLFGIYCMLIGAAVVVLSK